MTAVATLCARSGREHVLRLLHVQRKRLLADHMFPRGKRGEDVVVMREGRRGYGNNVNVGAGEQLRAGGERVRDLSLGGNRLRVIGRGERDDLEFRMSGERGQMRANAET